MVCVCVEARGEPAGIGFLLLSWWSPGICLRSSGHSNGQCEPPSVSLVLALLSPVCASIHPFLSSRASLLH